MDGVNGLIEREMRAGIQTYFVVPQLYVYAMACLEDKLKESIIFGQMTELHYRMFGGTQDTIYTAAASVEFMVLGLDIMDDLQDQDNMEKVWAKLPPAIALNIALGFLTLSQQLLLTSSFPPEYIREAAQLMNQQTLIAINGQTTDLLNEVHNEEDYIEMISKKSAALLVSACMVGTILAVGRPVEEVEQYARELGLAAQMKNDIKDIVNWDRKNDFWERKKTLPVLYLLQALSEEERWVEEYFYGRLEREEVQDRQQELEALIERSGAVLYTSVRMRVHYYNYIERVGQLQMEPVWKERMLALAE